MAKASYLLKNVHYPLQNEYEVILYSKSWREVERQTVTKEGLQKLAAIHTLVTPYEVFKKWNVQ